MSQLRAEVGEHQQQHIERELTEATPALDEMSLGARHIYSRLLVANFRHGFETGVLQVRNREVDARVQAALSAVGVDGYDDRPSRWFEAPAHAA